MRTITGLYDSYDDARAAVKALEDAGVSSDDISIVSHKNGKEDIEGQGSNAAEGAGTGAGIGAVAGGAGGLLAGLGIFDRRVIKIGMNGGELIARQRPRSGCPNEERNIRLCASVIQ